MPSLSSAPSASCPRCPKWIIHRLHFSRGQMAGNSHTGSSAVPHSRVLGKRCHFPREKAHPCSVTDVRPLRASTQQSSCDCRCCCCRYLYYFYHQSHDSTWCLRMSPHTGNSGKCTPFKSTEVSAANPHSGSCSGELDQDMLHSPRPRVLISPDALGLQGMRL